LLYHLSHVPSLFLFLGLFLRQSHHVAQAVLEFILLLPPPSQCWDLRQNFLFVVLGFELRAFILSHSTSPIFVKGFFEIGSLELFAQAGFELQSS
jgi:hypothetical protein